MTTTEEIVVSGEGFIERRIVLLPEQNEIAALEERAYRRGYQSGFLRGLLMGAAVILVAVVCIWLAQ